MTMFDRIRTNMLDTANKQVKMSLVKNIEGTYS